MSPASHDAWSVHRVATGWTGLVALVVLAGCGGEQRESADTGTAGAVATDTAAVPATDTAAPGPADTAAEDTDTSTVQADDTTAKQRADRSTTPGQPAPPKPAPSTPKPAPPAPKPDTTAAAAQDTAATAGGDTAAGQTQTATEPLRDQYHQAPKDTVDQTTYNGWKQYNLNCARCHGEDVLGTTIAPHLLVSLKPDGPINTKEAFVQVVCAGRPAKGMPAWCSLGMDPATIDQIHAYVKARSDGKMGPGRPAVKEG
jgi:Cytochrome C oxidase, cbb3-type, subunit III